MTSAFHDRPMPTPSTQRLDLFVASLLGLFFEVLVVRWLASEIRLFSFFKNLTLLAAFLGLGIGFAVARNRNDFLRLFSPFLSLYVALVLVIGRLVGRGLLVPESSEYLWRPSPLPTTMTTMLFILIVALFFLYTLLLFVPLGQLTGRLMIGLRPLSAYMINVLGSLTGIWVFAAISYFCLPPWAWFSLGLAFLAWIHRHSRTPLIVDTLALFVVATTLAFMHKETLWSPYYRVELSPLSARGEDLAASDESGYDLLVNKIEHMTAVNLSPSYLDAHPDYANSILIRSFGAIYNVPYLVAQPDSVLVVGAGTGNDVAAALRNGVNRVDAVEIDPLIHWIAEQMHPEHPYSSPRVQVHIDDARAYFEKTDQQYDLIVFGILDSQTMLSGMSSVRLDNFVYTLESMMQVRDRLSEKGIVTITFFAERWWIKQRLGQLLQVVFGTPPIQVNIAGTPWVTYIGGYGGDASKVQALCAGLACDVEVPKTWEPIPLPTDDWPYLYLKDRTIPFSYWIVLAIVLITAWISMRRVFPGARGMNWHFFFLGGAFLLIEFKIVTELALLFGSTWIVNAIAISAVLTMVLLANLLVSKLKLIDLSVLYVLLFLSLTLGYLVPLRVLLPYGYWVRAIASTLLMGSPLLFASTIFATSLKQSSEINLAFSSNFYGSAVGGVLEYGSLMIGIHNLYLVGAIIYLASWLLKPRH